MSPSQTSTDIDQDCKPHHSTKHATDVGNKSFSVKSEEVGSHCTDYNDEKSKGKKTVADEQAHAAKNVENVEVDIITCTKIINTGSAKAEDPDETECSSSFADSTSDTEKYSGVSEAEVESQYFGDSDLASPYSAFGSIFETRKKKLTNHWRSFIRPLMWRCKWTELKIKEIEHQALRYSQELEAFEQRKHSRIHQSMFEGFCSRSLPFSNQHCRRKAIRKRKRKRVEDMADTTSCMSLHNLFSYLENKKSNPDGTSMVDDFGKSAITDQCADGNDKYGIENDQSLFELGDGDNSLEQVLWKIEIVNSRVQKLKNQLDLVMLKNASKFSSSENLSLLAPCDGQTSSAPSPTFSPGHGETVSVGGIYTATQHISGFDIGDLVLPEIAMSSYGEDIHVPDIIESTVGLLSAADVTFRQPEAQTGDSCEDIVDNVLIHNEPVEEEKQAFVGLSNQLTEQPHEPEKGEEGESTSLCSIPTSEPDPVTKTIASQGQPTLRSCLASDLQFPRNKRKRVERKAGSAGWSKKSSGDPDSQ